MVNFTKRQWSTLIVIGIADFCNAVCVSLQAPFYPQVKPLSKQQKNFVRTVGQYSWDQRFSTSYQTYKLPFSDAETTLSYNFDQSSYCSHFKLIYFVLLFEYLMCNK
uniref:Uncharacterized protein LOC114339492 isoform X1 n=1 Tax=Diabrotica virgifera virgifera TaxID=50390 RepID=A0A6P7G9P8_DIAVI